MEIRLADERDIDQLIRMRYDFTLEYSPDIEADYELFFIECKRSYRMPLQVQGGSFGLLKRTRK